MTLSVSIITPSFNQGRFIERTIQSVLNQNVPDLEYLVFDGASTDDTVSILQRYSASLKFISEKDHGQSHAVNKGLIASSGDIIGWLNSDDIYYPNTLKKVCEFFAAHPEVDIVYGDAYHIDQEDQIIEKYPTESWNIKRLKQTCYLSQPAVFWQRRIIEKLGLLNEQLNYCMDYEYWLRLALGKMRFHYLPEVLAGSRLYPQTKTLSDPSRVQQEIFMMLRDRVGYVPDEWLLKRAVTLVKAKSQLRFPNVFFILYVYGMAVRLAGRESLMRGMRALLMLPVVMVKMFWFRG
jgi:glycosyltransferase involved in cell wall biosynthesis